MRFKGFVGEVIGILLVGLALSIACVYVAKQLGRMDQKLRRQALAIRALHEAVRAREAPAKPRAAVPTLLLVHNAPAARPPRNEPAHFFSVSEVSDVPSPKPPTDGAVVVAPAAPSPPPT